MGDPNDLLLPAGTRLIHIGPHKTGTSALQGAIHQARGELASHGVHVAGEPPRPSRAVWAVTGGTGPIGAPRAAMKHWNRLVAEIDAAGDQRVVVSNETFSLARADAISRIVGDLGPERVHVVGMLRRLDKILPSQWQQMIADGGHRVSYDGWLSSVFGARRPEGFWRRHGYGDVTRRWAEGVGVENVTMVVVDETDREVNLRLFEKFLGLPDGILQLVETRENRSLTFGEVEMLRAFNAEFRDLGWVNEAQPQYVRRGAIPSLKQRKPEPDEARIVTPQWALDRATEAAQEGIDAVRSLGVRVVGDLSALVRPPEPPATAVPDPATTMVEPATAALAVSGVIEIATTQAPLPHLYKTPDTDSGKVDPGKVDPGKVDPGLREVEAMTTHELVDVLRARVRLRPRPGRARPTVPGQTSPGQTSPGSPGSHTVPDPAPLLPRGALLVHVDPDDPRGPGSDASRKAAGPGGRRLVGSGLPVGAAAERVREAVGALGGDRVHVLATVRPPDEAMAARWRRLVLDGGTTGYEDWLDEALNRSGADGAGDPGPAHRPGEVVARWSEAVGPGRVTVVVLDPADPARLQRAVGEMLGLPGSFAHGSFGDAASRRPLTYGETEVVRGLNAQYRANGWPAAAYERYVRDGAVSRLRRRVPDPAESVAPVPSWAGRQLAEAGADAVRRIERLDVAVVGDLSALAGGGVPPSEPLLPPRAGALALVGAIAATSSGPAADMSSPALAGVVGRRLLKRSLRRVRRARRRRRR